MKSDYGEYWFESGACYKGEWRGNVFEGSEEFRFSDGRIYLGVGLGVRSAGIVVSIFRVKEFVGESLRRTLWRARGPMNFSTGQSMSVGFK